jgi:hypothetical protein
MFAEQRQSVGCEWFISGKRTEIVKTFIVSFKEFLVVVYFEKICKLQEFSAINKKAQGVNFINFLHFLMFTTRRKGESLLRCKEMR